MGNIHQKQKNHKTSIHRLQAKSSDSQQSDPYARDSIKTVRTQSAKEDHQETTETNRDHRLNPIYVYISYFF